MIPVDDYIRLYEHCIRLRSAIQEAPVLCGSGFGIREKIHRGQDLHACSIREYGMRWDGQVKDSYTEGHKQKDLFK